MKNLKAVLILVAFGIVFSIGVLAQPPIPPSDPTTGGNQPAGPSGAPIDPGTGIFLLLAGGYGLKKVYDLKRKSVDLP